MIQAGMKKWDIPGLSIAVVHDNNVVFCKGYGVRSDSGKEPVNEETVFGIGSTTKAFTSACIAMLVDEGKLDWDDLVIKHIPELAFNDPYLTNQMTVRDLLTHRTGLEQADFLWLISGYKDFEIRKRMKFLKQEDSFRNNYIYNNLTYSLLGEIIARKSGMPWPQFVRERIFMPLGMYNTSSSFAELKKVKNLAIPHSDVTCERKMYKYRSLDCVAAAGAINSSAKDMARWLAFNIHLGTVGGRKLVEARHLFETHRAQIVVRPDKEVKKNGAKSPLGDLEERPSPFLTYGLGWHVQEYGGRKILWHVGGNYGTRSVVGLLPQEKVGVVVLTNTDYGEGRFHQALMLSVFDRYLHFGWTDWDEAYWKDQVAVEFAEDKEKKDRWEARIRNTKSTLPFDGYSGTYCSDLYGDVRVYEDKETGKLMFHYGPEGHGELRHYNYDTFLLVWDDPGYGEHLATFQLDDNKRPVRVSIDEFDTFNFAHQTADASSATSDVQSAASVAPAAKRQ